MFVTPNFFGGEPSPKLLDLHYKTEPGSDHEAVSRRSAEGPWRLRVEKRNIMGKIDLPYKNQLFY